MTMLKSEEIVNMLKTITELPYGYTRKPDFSKYCHLLAYDKRDSKYSSWWRYLETIYLFCEEERGRVLDLGSGWGTNYHALKNLNFDVWATDISNPSGIDKERFQNHDLNIDGDLPYESESFDAVICSEVIEHIYKPYELISEMGRILRPGGFVILTTPNILTLPSRINFLRNNLHNKYPWVKESNNRYMPKHGIGGHVMPLDYFQLNHFFGNSDMSIDKIRTNIFTKVKKSKKMALFLSDKFINSFTNKSIPKELRRGDSLVLKFRKKF